MEVIAKIRSEFPGKFGIPRQSNLVESTVARVVFEEKYRVSEALRGIEDYDYLWLIWEFSENKRSAWSPTVRPPRLGGNVRVGVFATRSSFRPNSLGLSSVKLLRVEETKEEGSVLVVSGADLMDGTPIYDIKPYLPFTDSHKDAKAGFTDEKAFRKLTVHFLPEAKRHIAPETQRTLEALLSEDPRPAYQADGRVYAFEYASMRIRFTVTGEVLTVISIETMDNQ